jgi:2',3'-cyclic-nucleotide 2'-phosphodiesterase/3'-nucleotidase
MVVRNITAAQSSTRITARLRILATTDLHGHLLPHDYIKDQPTQGGGLAGLAHLITAQRAQADAAGIPVVLLDNGDTFQGTPLASYLALHDVGDDHPIVASLNHLRYAAIGLGNHDLDHGLPYLKAVAQKLDMPILSTNLRDISLNPLRDSLLLQIPLGADAPAPLTVGILSMLPEQSTAWNSHHLGPQVTLVAPSQSITTAAQALRAAGADLVVVLAHLGVGHADSATDEGQAAQALARSGQIDALILGHTHRRLPSDEYAGRTGVDLGASTVGGVAALMAGHAGSDLGVMDLSLGHEAGQGWQIISHACTLLPNNADVIPDPAITAFASKFHEKVRVHLSQQVATTSQVLHSYFSLVTPAPTQQLTAQAQYAVVSTALADTAYAGLPVLSAVAAHAAGGRDGLGNYIHIPSGPVLRRHIAGLNRFSNQTVGIRITGSHLRHWLEHSALLFNSIQVGLPDQLLANPDIPAFQFDTIFGLEYRIDLRATPYERIKDLRYEGIVVEARQEFILATNQFRASGGGGYASTPPECILMRSTVPLHDSMIEILRTSVAPPWGNVVPWRFVPIGGAEAMIRTHPDAQALLGDIAHLSPKVKGTTPQGFIRLQVTL